MTMSSPARTGPVRQATDPAVRGRLLARVEDRLTRFVADERARWCAVAPHAAVPIDAVAALLQAGGKRIRPVFCLTGYLAVGGDPEDPGAVDAAAALELLQAFALLHDDVIDDSALRRGRPTAHSAAAAEHARAGWQGESRRYGDGVGILAGDLAYAWADRLATGLAPAARAVWDELRTEMIIGQSIDIVVAAQRHADPELARWIALCKSGHYTIHRPLLLGATVAGRPDLTAVFEDYGLAVGEAFQLRDDLIDAFGDSSASGKPAGLDFDQHKMTLLLALVMQRDGRVHDLVSGWDRGGRWDAAALRGLLEGAGVRADVERHIDDLVRTARAAIADAPLPEVWRDELAHLAGRIAYRDR
jgi:geranylgeranyl diphosphate synthase type I